MDNTKTFVVKAPEGPRPMPPPFIPDPYPTGKIIEPPPVDFDLMDILGTKVNPNKPLEIEPPPELVKANEENPNWIHNWMYSIVPGPSFDMFLAGYCKGCRSAFTYKLPISPFNEIRFINNIPVPRYGCVGPQ